MNEKRTPWLLVVGGVVGLALVVCVVQTLSWSGSSFASNGEQIYFTATSPRGTPITSDMDMGMGMMQGGMMTCVSCHDPDGRGGRVRMMMSTFVAPDIRYNTLTSEEHGEEMEHESYTDETIKRAITDGVEPNGEPLDWPMPRWSMSDEDLDDLIEFLKTLD